MFVGVCIFAGCFAASAAAQIVDDGNEPPLNPYLADSPWPMSHRNSYCQASSNYPGPENNGEKMHIDYLPGHIGLITMAVSGLYPDGSRVLWGSNLKKIVKTDENGNVLAVLAELDKKEVLNVSDFGKSQASLSEKGKTGAYTLVDRNGIFYGAYFNRIYSFGDAVPGEAGSAIEIKSEYIIPPEKLHGENDFIIGLTLLYDGMLAFATSRGTVGVVSRSFDNEHYLNLGEDEETSNSIAACEKNGIYVVTNNFMYRVQWTGAKLSIDENVGGWRSGYETGDNATGLRLGNGSGATPSLMGTEGQDKFVVITDGQQLMHLVLFWRDTIPEDWQQLEGTRDRRIAAQVPVNFGDSEAKQSLSEQSVCVRGYGALVVNNLLGIELEKPALNILISGIPRIAPRGAEKFVWNHDTRTLSSAWVNTTVSLPNGIPAMSAATNLAYCIGQRNGVWNVEAIDWTTGTSTFYSSLGRRMKYNSAYSAMEIGSGGHLFSGSLKGVLRIGYQK